MSIAARCKNLSLAVTLLFVPLGCGDYETRFVAAASCSEHVTSCSIEAAGHASGSASVCIDGDLTAALNLNAANENAACANVISGAKLYYQEGIPVQNYVFQEEFTASYPPACVSALTGGASVDQGACRQIQTNLGKGDGTSATCSLVEGACVCQLTRTIPIFELQSDPDLVCQPNTIQRKLIAGGAYVIIQDPPPVSTGYGLPNNG